MLEGNTIISSDRSNILKSETIYMFFAFVSLLNTLLSLLVEKLMGCWDGQNSQKYTGFVSWTKNGRTCQSWTAQEPQEHRFKTDDFFPLDGSVADAENNCRDPDNDGTPWCYTTNKDIRWEYCDIPICKYARILLFHRALIATKTHSKLALLSYGQTFY